MVLVAHRHRVGRAPVARLPGCGSRETERITGTDRAARFQNVTLVRSQGQGRRATRHRIVRVRVRLRKRNAVLAPRGTPVSGGSTRKRHGSIKL